jgi:hypothetical protein
VIDPNGRLKCSGCPYPCGCCDVWGVKNANVLRELRVLPHTMQTRAEVDRLLALAENIKRRANGDDE